MTTDTFRMLTALALAAALGTAFPARAAAAEPTLLIIGVDISQSNPLVLGPQMDGLRARARERVREAIGSLELGSIIMIRTFGDNAAMHPALGRPDSPELIVYPRHPVPAFRSMATARAALADAYVARVDAAIAAATAAPDPYTRIRRFLRDSLVAVNDKADFTDPVRQIVTQRRVKFLLLTDGVEDDPPVRLLRGSALGAPGFTIPRCSELRMVGFGQAERTMPAAQLTHLQEEWQAWSAAVGCPFVGDAGR